MSASTAPPDVPEIGYKILKGVPIFCMVPDVSPEQTRVFGYKFSRRTGLVMYPAFLPLAKFTLEDLELVFGEDLAWTPEAEAAKLDIELRLEKEKSYTLPESATFVLPPFDHQREGICHALCNERYALFHDCGLGKTKTMIDSIRLLREAGDVNRSLIVCPPHLVNTWRHELQKHTFDEELTSCALVDDGGLPLPKETRIEHYTGERDLSPDPASRFFTAYPDLYYEPLPSGLPQEVYDIEDQYVEAIVSDDSKARSSARGKLRRRSKKYGFDLPKGRWRVLDPAPNPVSSYDVLITSYSIAVADFDYISMYYDYDLIVADESHNLRSYKSQKTKAACKLASKAKRRYLLSGTPSLGNPMHLYKQLKFLSPQTVSDWFKYTRRYIVKGGDGKIVVGFKNLHVLNDIVSTISHRKKQEDCLDLPELRVIDYPVHLDDETKHIYNELVATWSTSFTSKEKPLEVIQATDRINKLLQVLSGFYTETPEGDKICEGCPNLMHCAQEGIQPHTSECVVSQTPEEKTIHRLKTQPKRDATMHLINDILVEESNKVIVWCNYTEELNILQEALQDANIGHVRVDGKTRNKSHAETKFREDKDCRVYLSHIAISEGLTLNSANYTIFYGMTFDLKNYLQAIKRNHRIGQERRVTVYRMVTPRSVHTHLIKALDQKEDIANTMTDAIRCGLCEFSERCSRKGIKPFEEECIYSPSKNRIVVRPALL